MYVLRNTLFFITIVVVVHLKTDFKSPSSYDWSKVVLPIYSHHYLFIHLFSAGFPSALIFFLYCQSFLLLPWVWAVFGSVSFIKKKDELYLLRLHRQLHRTRWLSEDLCICVLWSYIVKKEMIITDLGWGTTALSHTGASDRTLLASDIVLAPIQLWITS